jgi:uncharacterized membrane protein required for colicin V production
MLKKLRKSKLSYLDRGLGLIFGFLRAFLLVVLFNMLLNTLLPEEAKNPFFADSRYFTKAGEFAEPLKSFMPEETLNKLKEKSTETNSKIQNNPEELFKELAEPKTSKVATEPKPKEQEEGYDKQETQGLDRLIENAAE